MIVLEITAGELLDRLAILELKVQRCAGEDQRRHAAAALDRVRAAWRAAGLAPARLPGLVRELGRVNAALWDAEDEIRERERRMDFGDAFLAVAREICRLNDRRAVVKRSIDDLCGFQSTDDKTYSGAETQCPGPGPLRPSLRKTSTSS